MRTALLNVLIMAIMAPVMATEPHESAELAAQREKMKQRQRRLVYNNDSGDIYPAEANTVEGFYAQRMNATIGTQVDSVFYCTGATVMFSHLAKVGETYGQYCGEMPIGHNIQTLKDTGHDVLDLVIEFCRNHDKEIFFTHRINDIHDTLDGYVFELSAWKRKHPQYWICEKGASDDEEDPKFWWSSLNFDKQPVRDYLIAIVEDVCSRYDIDGYDVDYFRSPMFFTPTLEYQPVTQAQLDLLTDFQRKIRTAAYKYGNERGRPILVSVRVPMTVKACRHVGIDLQQWLEEDLFDILCTGGGYVPYTMPTRELVALGHKYQKPVYPMISASGLRDHDGVYRDLHAWRAAAANVWYNDADGVLLFNTFPREKNHPHFTELGNPDTLAKLNKLYAIDNKATLEGDLRQGIAQSHILPVELDSGGKPRSVILPIGEDVSKCRGQYLDFMLSNDAGVEIRLNGHLLKQVEMTPQDRRRHHPTGNQFRLGDNAIEFRVIKPAAEPTQVIAVELHVNH